MTQLVTQTSHPIVSADPPTLQEAGRPLIVIADDHKPMRDALTELFETVGLETLAFSNARDLLACTLPDRPGCFVLDVRMPGLSGLDLQHHLTRSGSTKPIIFLTAHADVPLSIRAMKAGATDFLEKPFRDQELLDAVWLAVDADRDARSKQSETRDAIARYDHLSFREQQVLRLLVAGKLHKQIAWELGVSIPTIKLHRGNLTRKLGVRSMSELLKIWQHLPAAIQNNDLV